MNHLGNVLTVITDNRAFNGNNWETDILNEYYYYPFGMTMPERVYSSGSGYRYEFNGKENDNEVSGEGNKLDFAG